MAMELERHHFYHIILFGIRRFENMKISVIVPMYNSERTIKKALDSIYNQSTLELIEVIIINDGSVDKSEEIVHNYINEYSSANRKFILINQENHGASYARNKGIKVSSGEYISFLDADDYFHRQKFEILLLFFTTYLDIDVIGHSFNVNIDKFEDFNIKTIFSTINKKKVTFFNLLVKNFATTPSVMFRNNVNTLFDENMRYTEDHDFFLRLCYKRCNMYFIDIPLVSLGREVLSNGGLSDNKLMMRLGEIKMYLKLWRLDKRFIFMLPFLIIYSIFKHIIKLRF